LTASLPTESPSAPTAARARVEQRLRQLEQELVELRHDALPPRLFIGEAPTPAPAIDQVRRRAYVLSLRRGEASPEYPAVVTDPSQQAGREDYRNEVAELRRLIAQASEDYPRRPPEVWDAVRQIRVPSPHFAYLEQWLEGYSCGRLEHRLGRRLPEWLRQRLPGDPQRRPWMGAERPWVSPEGTPRGGASAWR
jgi:hypothetical protein